MRPDEGNEMIRPCSTAAVLLATLLTASTLAGCEKSEVAANINAVNYSADEFSYYVNDPATPTLTGGGELVGPFGAGGITCCFTLPKKWRPGIKVEIHATHWLPAQPDGRLPEVHDVHLVEVPAYVDDKPGDLWVIRALDGSFSVVSSDFQPNHSKWPGKVKGWPVPSVEYQRARWEIIKEHEEGGVRLFSELLKQLESDPQRRAKEAWTTAMEYEKSSIKDFNGPTDPRYLIQLKKEYEEGLKYSQDRVTRLMKERP
jgi:hypothetical protein